MLEITRNTGPRSELFDAPRVGDHVVVHSDTLAEQARTQPGLPPTWLFLPAGLEGTVVGFRERQQRSFAMVELAVKQRVVMYVGEDKLHRIPGKVRAPAPRRLRLRLRRGHR